MCILILLFALINNNSITFAQEWRFSIALRVYPDATIDVSVEGKIRKAKLAFIERILDTKSAKAILHNYGGAGLFIDKNLVVFKYPSENKNVNLTLVCAGFAEPLEIAPLEYLLCWAQNRIKKFD